MGEPEVNVEDLIRRVTAQIEGQNWIDHPLTDGERIAIEMAVRATVFELRANNHAAKR